MVPAPETSTVLRASVCWFSSPALIEPTMVTSRPSRTQVRQSKMTPSQCHRLQGRRSILAGIVVLTAFVLDLLLLLTASIVSQLLCSFQRCSDYACLFSQFADEWVLLFLYR